MPFPCSTFCLIFTMSYFLFSRTKILPHERSNVDANIHKHVDIYINSHVCIHLQVLVYSNHGCLDNLDKVEKQLHFQVNDKCLILLLHWCHRKELFSDTGFQRCLKFLMINLLCVELFFFVQQKISGCMFKFDTSLEAIPMHHFSWIPLVLCK